MSVSYHARPWGSAHPALLALALPALSFVLLGCGPPQEPRTPPREPIPPEPSVPQTERLVETAQGLPVLLSSVETLEHFGEHLVGELRMTESSHEAYRAGLGLPEGTRIALMVRRDASSPLQVLWMEKSENRWQFAVELDQEDSAAGRTASEPTASCVGCHARAALDHVFRIGADSG